MTPAYDGPENAEVLVVGESWGFHEANYRPRPKPFVGPSGQLLDQLLSSAGYSRSRVRVTNVVHAQPPSNKIDNWLADVPGQKTAKAQATALAKLHAKGLTYEYRGKMVSLEVWEGIQELHREIARMQPRLIIAFGNVPLWALTGEWGITQWRGSEMRYESDTESTNIPVIPTLHPAYILRSWKEKPIVIHDLRVRAFGKLGQDANRQPIWRFSTDQKTLDRLERELGWILSRLNEGPMWLSTDVETRRNPPRNTCVGYAWTTQDAICVPLERASGALYWGDDDPYVRTLIEQINEHPNARHIGQNFNYDAQYLELDELGRVKATYDTGIAQHLMFPGMQKDLARLSSMYCTYHYYWKDDLKDWAEDVDEQRMWNYNCIDTIRTYEVAMKQQPALVKMGLHQGVFLK